MRAYEYLYMASVVKGEPEDNTKVFFSKAWMIHVHAMWRMARLIVTDKADPRLRQSNVRDYVISRALPLMETIQYATLYFMTPLLLVLLVHPASWLMWNLEVFFNQRLINDLDASV